MFFRCWVESPHSRSSLKGASYSTGLFLSQRFCKQWQGLICFFSTGKSLTQSLVNLIICSICLYKIQSFIMSWSYSCKLMPVRIYKLLQKPGAKLIVLVNSHLFVYYLFHTSLLLSFSTVPPQSQNYLGFWSECRANIESWVQVSRSFQKVAADYCVVGMWSTQNVLWNHSDSPFLEVKIPY